MCGWARVSAAPRHSWLGCCGLCVPVCALRLSPVHSWLGCAVWVCVLRLQFRLRPATPGWAVGVCVCLCARPACTPPLLAGVSGVRVWCCLAPVPVPWFVACCPRCPGFVAPVGTFLGTCPCALVVAGGVPLWRAWWPPSCAPRLVRSGRSRCFGRLSRRRGAFPPPWGLRPGLYWVAAGGTRRPAENRPHCACRWPLPRQGRWARSASYPFGAPRWGCPWRVPPASVLGCVRCGGLRVWTRSLTRPVSRTVRRSTGDSAGAPGLFRAGVVTSPCGSEDATPGSRACVRVLVRRGRVWAGRPPGRVLVRLTFSSGRFVFLLCSAPSGLGLLLLWFLGCLPPPLFFSSCCCVFCAPPTVSFFLWFPATGALGLGALFFFPPCVFFLIVLPRCLLLSPVSGPGCPGPWRCVLFFFFASRSSALRALSPPLWFPPGCWLLPGGFSPPPPSFVSRCFSRCRFLPLFFSFFFFLVARPRCLRLSLISGPARPGPWCCVLFVLLASRSSALRALSPLLWFPPGRWLLPGGCCPPPPFLCLPFFFSLPLFAPFFFSRCAPQLSLAFSGFRPRVPWALALCAVCFVGLPLRAVSPLLWFPPGRWLLPGSCCPPPPFCFVSRCFSRCRFVLRFFFSSRCAPPLSLAFPGFRAWVPWALALCAVSSVGLPLPGSRCALASFVGPAWPLAALWWLLPPPPLFCVSLFFSLPLCAPFFFLSRCAPPLSLAFSGFRPRVPWALALCAVCSVGLPLLSSPCALASFVVPAWRLAAPWWLLPPPPFMSRGFRRCCSLLFFFFFLLVGGSHRLLPPPPCCVRGALCCLMLLRCAALPCCVLCCGASPCCVVGCCALCGVCWGVCFCVVLRCWLLLRVVPCLWSCRSVGLFAVWLAAWFWSALPCAVLCCVSLGAVLRRAAARRASRCCVVLCCVVLLRLFGVTACCAVSSGAARRPGALCFAALSFAVFPRALCSVLCVFCLGALVRAVVRLCAACCVCPGVSRCAFPVLSALCSAVFRCAGALASCCSCGACCC